MSNTVAIITLCEYAASDRPLKIDTDAGVINSVKVLGLNSANGRRYLREAVERARGLYEGRVVNLDHPTRSNEPTSVTRRFGWLESVRQGEDGGLYANLHYLKSHPSAPAIVEAAQRNPRLLGLSHNAKGRERRVNGESVIETIESVLSVDLVADPATVSGLFEGKTMPTKRISEEAEAGLMSPDPTEKETPMAQGEEMPVEGGGHEDALKQGFKSAIHAIVDDDGMEMQEKLSKIKEILKAQEKLLAGDSEPAAEEPPAEEPAEEGKKQDKGNLLEGKDLQIAILRECLQRGIQPNKVLEKALSACSTLQEAQELLADYTLSKPVTGNKPRSTNPQNIKESVEVPTDPKAFARFLRS